MYIISKGLEVSIRETQIDPEHIYVTSGIVLNQTKQSCIVVIPNKVNKIPNKTNYLYYDCPNKVFINSETIIDDFKMLPISIMSIDANSFMTSITVPTGTTLNFVNDSGNVVSSVASVTHETTETNILVINGTITVHNSILDIVQLYIHNIGIVSNLSDIISSINNKVITLNMNDLDGSYVDVNYQYLA
jgi:hypothetical protein